MTKALKKIMVVDDDASLNQLLSEGLKRAGYDVVSVHNGFQASREVIRQSPDLVLMDISMPMIDGMEVCGSVKKRMKEKAPKIIIISANYQSDAEGLPFAREVGADDFFAKPLDFKRVLLRIIQLTSAPACTSQTPSS